MRRTKVAVVYHSRGGRTRALAEAVIAGASSVDVDTTLVPVEEASAHWLELAAADAIVFGSPTFMGSVSAPFKAFMDATFDVWIVQGWREKLAAGFTSSSAPSGDKLATLMQLAVFAAQHGMMWVGLGLHPSHAGARSATPETGDDVNRLGSHLGAMAQASIGATAPPKGDVETAFFLGKRVAESARRWVHGEVTTSADRHPTAKTWAFPPAREPLPEPLRRTNLRELAARPDRIEHHLTVVARVGNTQLEVVAASEPLAFAHRNRSDEYALALPSGDPMLDGFPLRTFLTDADTGEDVGRIQHRVGDLVLHPHGLLHWPGRLRPPYEPYPFGPGMRRTGLSMVFCACEDVAPTDRPLFVTPGREADVKAYVGSPPFLLCETRRNDPGRVASIGTVSLELVVAPRTIAPPQGGYVLVLEAESPHFACDLVYVPEGSSFDATGVGRALVLSGARAMPPPESWDAVPAPPFEEGAGGTLPMTIGALRIDDAGACVRVSIDDARAEVPRHWLARLLYRVALHGFSLGYVETYGGFFVGDRDGLHVGLRAGGRVAIERGDIERLYRAVAPSGHRERLD